MKDSDCENSEDIDRLMATLIASIIIGTLSLLKTLLLTVFALISSLIRI